MLIYRLQLIKSNKSTVSNMKKEECGSAEKVIGIPVPISNYALKLQGYCNAGNQQNPN